MRETSPDFSGRRCTVCAHPDADRITADLRSGASVTGIVRRLEGTSAPLSRDALYRHLKAHANEREGQLQIMNQPPALTIARRIGDIADAARAARTGAYAAGNLHGGARAGDSELRALIALADRLGVTHDDVIEDVDEMVALAKAVGQAARRSPAVGEAIALRLEANGQQEIADELRKAAINPPRKVTTHEA